MGLSVTVIHLQAYFLFTDTDIEMRVFCTEVYNLRVEAKISEDVKSLSNFRKILSIRTHIIGNPVLSLFLDVRNQ